MFKYILDKASLINILILIFTFIFIFTPRLYMPFSFVHILTVISFYFLLTKYRKSFLSIITSSSLTVFSLIHILMILYLFTIIAMKSSNYLDLYAPVSMLIEIIPCIVFISIVCINQGYDQAKFYNLILVVGMLQVVCIIVSMISPELRNLMIESSGSTDLVDLYDQIGMFRIYGLAAGYTYSMPLFLGLCVLISYVLGMFKSYFYFLLIPLYLLSIAVNARIAIVSIFIVSIVTFIVQFKSNPYRQLINLFLLLLVIYIVVKFVGFQAESSSSYNGWVWFNSGIKEIFSLFGGELEGNMSALADSMWFLPKGVDILIGSGETVFARSYESSDIGYVINLHYGGLVLSTLLYLPYLWLLNKNKNANQIEVIVTLSILFYLIIANAKGNVFIPNEIIKGVLMLLVFSIATERLQVNMKIQP